MPPRHPIEEAFEYLFPLYEMARTRYLLIENPGNPRRQPPGGINHRRLLADHRARAVTTPNNDTLYSSSWLDLASAPIVLSVPAFGERYWSVAMMDIFTNNFAMLGSRLSGGGPLQVMVAGPDWQGTSPKGLRLIRSPSNDVWLLGRWLVDGPHDLEAVHALQDAMRIEILTPGRVPIAQKIEPVKSSDPANFLAVVNEMLGRNPAPAAHGAMLARWAGVGVHPGATSAWEGLSDETRSQWLERMAAVHRPLQAGFGAGSRRVGGWLYPPAFVGAFGDHFAVRAAVALGGLGALEPAEALYLGLDKGPDDEPLHGSRRYRLRVPADGIATDAFWSLSMYEIFPDGRLFFVDNPIKRYAVGDRTRDLKRNADGSIDLWIQHEQPGPDDQGLVNWLPAPAKAFQLTLRAYLPRETLMAGASPLPSIETVS